MRGDGDTCRQAHHYLPEGFIDEVNAEAARLERSASFLVQLAWRIAREEIRAMPAPEQQIREAAGRIKGRKPPC